MINEIDRQIELLYKQARSESRAKPLQFKGELPFPFGKTVLNGWDDTLVPSARALVELLGSRPGEYQISNFSYHPNSRFVGKPFVCIFEHPMDQMIQFGRVMTPEITIVKAEVANPTLEIREGEALPRLLVRNGINMKFCSDVDCPADIDCPSETIPIGASDTEALIDPVSTQLWLTGINPEDYDPLSRMLFYRYWYKLNFRRESEEQALIHKDDPTVFELDKRLGIFRTNIITSPSDWTSNRYGFELKKFERFLELHIPDKNEGFSWGIVSKARHSFEMIADYILLHNLNPKYVLGITYEKLALLGENFGFNSYPVNIQGPLREKFEANFRKNNPRGQQGKEMGRIVMQFQRTEDFLGRFAA